jgi:biopolymer transport protein ExbD
VAGVSTDQGGDNLNVELNLVPFIDLFSSLVLFLLVTAVWLQVGTIPASVESKGQSRFSAAESNRLTVRMTTGGIQVTWPASLAGAGLPAGAPNFQRLHSILASALAKMKSQPVVAVTSEDRVEYGAVIEAIDVIKKAGYNTVALGTD